MLQQPVLQQQHRLRRAADFKRVGQHGRRWRHPLAIFLVCATEVGALKSCVGAPHVSRFGFAASRRVGTAVARNRARRLLREAVRRHLHLIKPGYDCLLIARSATPHAGYAEVETAVLQLLRRAQLLRTTQER